MVWSSLARGTYYSYTPLHRGSENLYPALVEIGPRNLTNDESDESVCRNRISRDELMNRC